MSLPDNRLRFPATRIDFSADVGDTGQDHDDYPQPQSQARYDHMRMFLIALLSQQSSYEAPTQFREGTPWFDLNTLSLKIRRNGEWVLFSEAIPLTEPDTNGDIITLASWYASVRDTLVSLAPEVVFSGTCTTDSITGINIPSSLQSALATDSRVFLHINGSLVDPHNCTLIGTPPTSIRLSGVALNSGDTFIVSIRRISDATYATSTIVIP